MTRSWHHEWAGGQSSFSPRRRGEGSPRLEPDGAEGVFARPLCILLLCLTLATGCSSAPQLHTKFGQRGTLEGADSLAGTAALGAIFSAAGYRVYTRNSLSPYLNNHRVIVWAPDDFEPPDLKAVEYLERWLAGKPDRVLVYVCRDYDAASEYWAEIGPKVAAADAPEAARQLALARSRYAYERSVASNGMPCNWFQLDAKQPDRVTDGLEGRWSDGLEKFQLPLGQRIVAPDATTSSNWYGDIRWQPMLEEDDDVIVAQASRYSWNQSRVYIVANGSFLLNYPLTRPDRRRIAQRLVEECGPGGSVVFLETERGLPIQESSDGEGANPYAWLTVFPIGVLLLHLFFFGILLCAVAYPIFGRPRTVPAETHADFGAHVTALGELLARTENGGFAQQQIDHYRIVAAVETTRGAVGISSGKKKRPS